MSKSGATFTLRRPAAPSCTKRDRERCKSPTTVCVRTSLKNGCDPETQHKLKSYDQDMNLTLARVAENLKHLLNYKCRLDGVTVTAADDFNTRVSTADKDFINKQIINLKNNISQKRDQLLEIHKQTSYCADDSAMCLIREDIIAIFKEIAAIDEIGRKDFFTDNECRSVKNKMNSRFSGQKKYMEESNTELYFKFIEKVNANQILKNILAADTYVISELVAVQNRVYTKTSTTQPLVTAERKINFDLKWSREAMNPYMIQVLDRELRKVLDLLFSKDERYRSVLLTLTPALPRQAQSAGSFASITNRLMLKAPSLGNFSCEFDVASGCACKLNTGKSIRRLNPNEYLIENSRGMYDETATGTGVVLKDVSREYISRGGGKSRGDQDKIYVTTTDSLPEKYRSLIPSCMTSAKALELLKFANEVLAKKSQELEERFKLLNSTLSEIENFWIDMQNDRVDDIPQILSIPLLELYIGKTYAKSNIIPLNREREILLDYYNEMVKKAQANPSNAEYVKLPLYLNSPAQNAIKKIFYVGKKSVDTKKTFNMIKINTFPPTDQKVFDFSQDKMIMKISDNERANFVDSLFSREYDYYIQQLEMLREYRKSAEVLNKIMSNNPGFQKWFSSDPVLTINRRFERIHDLSSLSQQGDFMRHPKIANASIWRETKFWEKLLRVKFNKTDKLEQGLDLDINDLTNPDAFSEFLRAFYISCPVTNDFKYGINLINQKEDEFLVGPYVGQCYPSCQIQNCTKKDATCLTHDFAYTTNRGTDKEDEAKFFGLRLKNVDGERVLNMLSIIFFQSNKETLFNDFYDRTTKKFKIDVFDAKIDEIVKRQMDIKNRVRTNLEIDAYATVPDGAPVGSYLIRNNIDLALKENNTYIGILGPTGSGKSTVSIENHPRAFSLLDVFLQHNSQTHDVYLSIFADYNMAMPFAESIAHAYTSPAREVYQYKNINSYTQPIVRELVNRISFDSKTTDIDMLKQNFFGGTNINGQIENINRRDDLIRPTKSNPAGSSRARETIVTKEVAKDGSRVIYRLLADNQGPENPEVASGLEDETDEAKYYTSLLGLNNVQIGLMYTFDKFVSGVYNAIIDLFPYQIANPIEYMGKMNASEYVIRNYLPKVNSGTQRVDETVLADMKKRFFPPPGYVPPKSPETRERSNSIESQDSRITDDDNNDVETSDTDDEEMDTNQNQPKKRAWLGRGDGLLETGGKHVQDVTFQNSNQLEYAKMFNDLIYNKSDLLNLFATKNEAGFDHMRENLQRPFKMAMESMNFTPEIIAQAENAMNTMHTNAEYINFVVKHPNFKAFSSDSEKMMRNHMLKPSLKIEDMFAWLKIQPHAMSISEFTRVFSKDFYSAILCPFNGFMEPLRGNISKIQLFQNGIVPYTKYLEEQQRVWYYTLDSQDMNNRKFIELQDKDFKLGFDKYLSFSKYGDQSLLHHFMRIASFLWGFAVIFCVYYTKVFEKVSPPKKIELIYRIMGVNGEEWKTCKTFFEAIYINQINFDDVQLQTSAKPSKYEYNDMTLSKVLFSAMRYMSDLEIQEPFDEFDTFKALNASPYARLVFKNLDYCPAGMAYVVDDEKKDKKAFIESAKSFLTHYGYNQARPFKMDSSWLVTVSFKVLNHQFFTNFINFKKDQSNFESDKKFHIKDETRVSIIIANDSKAVDESQRSLYQNIIYSLEK